MARRSNRQSLASRKPASSSATPKTGGASARRDPPTKSRTPAKVTPQKSTYFDSRSKKDRTDKSDVSEQSQLLSDQSDDAEEGSGYEEEKDIETDSSQSDNESGDEYESDDIPASRKRGRPTKGTTPAAKRAKASEELWRPGAKTGLGPGTQLIIKKPKAKPAGNTPYKDDTIHPNTMDFLRDLAKNNDRQWLKMYDPDYRQSLQDFNTFLECLTQKVVKLDETVPELPVKDIIFRIYRDVRFSKDPTPYKTHFSAAWSRTGRKGPYAAYYVQIKPGGSFVGGGVWQPEADRLAALRQDIDRRPERIKAVLTNDRIRKDFFRGIPKDDKKAVKAFVSNNKESALKTKPKGFEADHANIDLLRLRNFTIGKKLLDKDILGPQSLTAIANLIASLVPFVTYINSVVMPDDAEASDSDDGESGEAGGDDAAEDESNDEQ